MKVSELLKQAKSLIEDEEHWCCGVFARDKSGNPCTPRSQKAVAWCSTGALQNKSFSEVYAEARLLLRKHMGMSVIQFNDSHTHEEVIKAWDAAIQEAEKL